MPFGDVSGERMPKKGIMQYYEKFSSVLEKARKSPWTRVAFWGGVAWLSYQQMFIWGVALFVIYEGWAEECISSKIIEYYEKAFSRLEETGKHTWNWAAFFGGITWMLYRKMYLYALALTLIYFGMDLCLGMYYAHYYKGTAYITYQALSIIEFLTPRMCLLFFAGYLYEFVYTGAAYDFANGWTDIRSWEIWTIAVTVVFIITRVCLGYFGNSLYYRIVKKRIKEGYYLEDKHCPTSIFSCFGSIFYLLGLGYHYTSEQKHVVNKGSIRDYLNPDR